MPRVWTNARAIDGGPVIMRYDDLRQPAAGSQPHAGLPLPVEVRRPMKQGTPGAVGASPW